MGKDFQERTALVTGAGSGIGAAVARILGQRGANVVVSDLEEDGARRVVDEISEAGGRAVAHVLDVTDAHKVAAAVDFCVRTFGALHHAVNNAGIGGPSADTAGYPVEGWHKVIDTNLNSVFYGLKYQIPAMISAGGGSIVNTASILGTNGFANSPAYVAAKHGVVGLTKTAAIEFAARGVRINAIGPGFIRTPLLDALDEAALAHITGLHPMGRLGTSEEVAELAVFLLSDKASFITGSYHLVDGAYAAQ